MVLAITWLAVNLLLYTRFGIVTGFESAKYVEQADLLIAQGNYASGNFIFYSVPIFLIALSKVSGTFPWLVVLLQLVVNAVSVFCFYRLALQLTRSHVASFVATFLLVTMIYYQLYNVYLFTESLYFSFSILYTWLLFRIRKRSAANLALLFCSLALLYFTRPTGVFFVPATILFLVFRFYRRKAWTITAVIAIASVFLLYLLINLALPSGGEFDFLLPYLDERVICGVPTIEQKHAITVPGEKNSVEGLWYVITHHTDLFVRLGARRLAAFFGVVRSHYSFWHNLYVVFYFWPLYLLIILGSIKLTRHFLPETLYLFANIFFIAVTVMLSCDEWHNRFILALLPFFLLLGFTALLAKAKTGE